MRFSYLDDLSMNGVDATVDMVAVCGVDVSVARRPLSDDLTVTSEPVSC